MISSPSGSAQCPTYKGGPPRPGQASADGETFALVQTGHYAAPQHLMEQLREQITVRKNFLATLQKIG